MKAFVTGGTGFVGQSLVRQLIKRGYEVTALARSSEGAARLAGLGAQVVYGDITDTASMRPGMEGSGVVFHVAGWYKVGARDWMKAESINVGGTRRVLRLAHKLGIPKIVYTSSVVVFGDTRGQLADETTVSGPPFVTEYDRTKWLAHYKVALPAIEKGVPVIIVMPGVVYGPGDHSLLVQLMRRFYAGQMPAVLGPETTVTYAHVDDIAEGHILAAEKGQIGETYILAGPAIPQGEMFDFWAQITGKPAPILRIPARLLRPFASLVGSLEGLLPLPEIASREALLMMGVTYMARANKARAQLGWQPRSLHAGMTETFDWIARTTPAEPSLPRPERKWAGAALAAAAALFFLWLLSRRK